jgi:hypothetical protein
MLPENETKIPGSDEDLEKNPVIRSFEKIASELRKEGYTVLLCISPYDPETGEAPRIAGTVTYKGTSENPEDVEFRTIEQIGLATGIIAPGGNA